MTSTDKRLPRAFSVSLVFLLSICFVYAQKPVENSVFWKISGKDLRQPSYLFGTFHLMGSHYIDSLVDVKERFHQCSTVVGEIVMDSTLTMKMMVAARLTGTTMDKLLKPEDYDATAKWLKDLSGYDLALFNGMNPITIQIFLMSMLQHKYYPLTVNDTPMDVYFQNLGKQQGKEIVGLETFEIQINALFNQFTLERQAAMLAEFVNQKDRAKVELIEMNKSYREGNLKDLEKLLAEQTYTKEESEVMLDNRNKTWLAQLPAIMKEGPTFIAVGALHLAGAQGLVALLRKAGYEVTPLKLKTRS